MTPLLLLLASLFFLSSSTLAIEYVVGVGQSELTGKDGLGFDPSSIRPYAGDTVVFEFNTGTHSVIQTTFSNPCTPMEGGFNSGDITVQNGTSGPTKNFIVPDAQPQWFYDGAPGLCGQGAVFSINPELWVDGQTAGKFLENAQAVGAGKAPLYTAPPNTSATTAMPTSTSASSTSSPSPTSSQNNASGLRSFPSTSLISFAGVAVPCALAALGML